LKLFRRSPDQNVTVDFGVAIPKIAVPADMVEMLFRIQHRDPVERPHGRRVSVNCRRGQRVCTSVNHERRMLARDKARIYRPRRDVGEPGDGEAARRHLHAPKLA
jgi:hypothetical protein